MSARLATRGGRGGLRWGWLHGERRCCASVQRRQMGQPQYVRWIRRREVERETEPLEVQAEVVCVRVAVVDFQLGSKLGLDQCLERGSHPGNDELGGFRVEVTTESLEVSAEQHNVAPQVLVDELGVWWHRRQAIGTLPVDMTEPVHPFGLPVVQRNGRHSGAPRCIRIGQWVFGAVLVRVLTPAIGGSASSGACFPNP